MSSSSFLGTYNPGNLTKKGGLNAALGYQYGQNQNYMNATQGQRGTETNSLIPGYQGLISGGGYSPTEKAAITQGAFGGVNEGYNTAENQAQRRLATTHNAAGYGSFMGSLARDKARDLSSTGLNVQSQFANEAYQRKLQGLQGLAQMYGVDTSFLNSLNNNQNQLLSIGSGVQSRSRGVLGTIGEAAGIAGKFLGV